MPLINCEINLKLTWSANCVITNSTGAETFPITNARLYVPVETLSTEGNTKLLQQLNSGFTRRINKNKDPKQEQICNLDYLVGQSCQGINRLLLLLFENEECRGGHAGYCLPRVERLHGIIRNDRNHQK